MMASVTAAGDGGRQQGGATAMGDGNDSNSNRQKGHKQAYLSKTCFLGARPAIAVGGEQVERLRQP